MEQKSQFMVQDHVKLKPSQNGRPSQKGSIMSIRKLFAVGLICVLFTTVAVADQRGVFVPQKSRTLTTQPFGSGTTTRSSNGYSSQTNKFGSGTITRERDGLGHQRTGTTQSFGSGTITRRSDGSSSQTNKFGSGTITRERDSFGHHRTGTTQPFGSGTITRRSDGSSSQTNKFGSGTITRETPGKSAFGTSRKK